MHYSKFFSKTRLASTPLGFLHQLAFSTIPNELTQTNRPHLYSHLLQLCLNQCTQVKAPNLFDERPQRLSLYKTTSKIIHAQSLKLGFWSGSLGNAIVDLYVKCGDVELAEKAFGLLESRDVIAWNSILSMYSRNNSFGLVMNNFGLLLSNNVVPNEFTFAIVLSACARVGSLEYGTKVHCVVVKVGLELISFCEGALIDMYAKCGFIKDARKVFDVASDVDTVSWTSMISGYIQAGFPEEALKLYEDLRKDGKELDTVAVVSVMNAYAALGRLDDASDLFFRMPNPNVVAWNLMISSHAKRGYEAEAIEYFRKMRKVGIKSTRSTLGSVLSAIASLAAYDHGLIVHAEAIKLGLNSNFYVGSSLISMYAKCEKMDAARKVFDSLDEQNVVVWNTILGGYAQNGCGRDVMELFSSMKAGGFLPDAFTYTSILSACSCLEDFEAGRQLHSVIIKNNLTANLFIGNALVDMYAKTGHLTDARQQFELIKNKDNISWNAIIVGYVQKEDEFEAFQMFRRMNSLGILPDEVSVASILSACGNVKGLEQGKQVHCLSVKCGLEHGLYAGSSLIDMYAKCGDIDSARNVHSLMPIRSVVSLNALIAGYALTSLMKAIRYLQEMQGEGFSPNEITFASILDACDEPQKLELGRQIHCTVLKRGLRHGDEFLGLSLLGMYMNCMSKTDASALFSEFSSPSPILWTAMISGLIRNDCSDEALQFYREMRNHNFLPDQATFVTVLRACSVLSCMRNGGEIHSIVFHTGYDLDEVTCSALVDMYSKCGDVKSAMQVFAEMHIKKDVISWNSMIVGLAKNGYAEQALRVYNEMKQLHVPPDEVTFLGVLTACSHAGRVSEGRLIFDSMVNYNIQPRVDHIACMVDLLGRWGFLKEAEEFIDKLDFEPNVMIWSTMLGACTIHGDDVRGQRAAEKLIELEPHNSSPYVLLSNIYAASGNWNRVNTLRSRMRENRVKKLPGCSWIVVGKETSLFIAGENSHTLSEEIDEVLNELVLHMRKGSKFDQNDLFSYDEHL